jgi:uncharacterized membrane protein YqaE (UPF0057 family)
MNRMKIFVRILMIALYIGAGFMAGMLVDGSDFLMGFISGRLYALYVLIYTGGAFMAGLWFGQRWERSWEAEEEAVAGMPESPRAELSHEVFSGEEVREPSELRH